MTLKGVALVLAMTAVAVMGTGNVLTGSMPPGWCVIVLLWLLPLLTWAAVAGRRR